MADGPQDEFAASYSERSFWDKLTHHARGAGEDLIYKALQLYYVLQKPDLPVRAKTVVYGALGYFIMPLDAIPDMLPATGFLDDLGVLAWAFATVVMHIDDDVRTKAKARLAAWLGENSPG